MTETNEESTDSDQENSLLKLNSADVVGVSQIN
jgi:hypothetical protein